MRTYGQFCALARALDVVGDRWTILIVRELGLGPARYGELREGLPGIATNLLADRLRHLQEHGLITHVEGTYQLAPRGEELLPVLRGLVRWGEPLMLRGPGDDHFAPSWALGAVTAFYEGVVVEPPVVVEVRVDGQPFTIEADGDGVRATAGPAPDPEVVLDGPPHGVLGVLSGYVAPRDAASLGATIEGDRRQLARLVAHRV